jgi:hypothetical protein
LTVIGKLPVWSGVPESVPLVARVRPAGSVPLFRLKVEPPIAPL